MYLTLFDFIVFLLSKATKEVKKLIFLSPHDTTNNFFVIFVVNP